MQAALMLHRQSQTRSGRQRLPAPRASSSPHPRLCNSYTGPELSAPTAGTYLHQAIMRCANLALGLWELHGPSHPLHTTCEKEERRANKE